MALRSLASRMRLHAMAASTQEMCAARMLINEAQSGTRGMILHKLHWRSRRKTCGVTTLGNVVLPFATSSAKTIQERGTCSAQSSLAVEASEYDRWEKGGGNVHRSAVLDPSVVVEVGGVVHAGAVIGASSHVGSGCIVGPNVSVGSSVVLRYNVVLQNCTLGDSCIIHSGVCIGQDGFGFTVNDLGEVVKKPQELQVKIGNNVEIGANTCIDRGSWRDTVIGDHTKIDNLVQIGHNVIIGRCCMICGQVGIAGSCTLGDYVVLGGQAGMADHVSIVSKVRIAAKSGVISDISKSGDYAGFPATAAPLWRRSMVAIRKLGGKASELDESHTTTTKVDDK